MAEHGGVKQGGPAGLLILCSLSCLLVGKPYRTLGLGDSRDKVNSIVDRTSKPRYGTKENVITNTNIGEITKFELYDKVMIYHDVWNRILGEQFVPETKIYETQNKNKRWALIEKSSNGGLTQFSDSKENSNQNTKFKLRQLSQRKYKKRKKNHINKKKFKPKLFHLLPENSEVTQSNGLGSEHINEKIGDRTSRDQLQSILLNHPSIFTTSFDPSIPDYNQGNKIKYKSSQVNLRSNDQEDEEQSKSIAASPSPSSGKVQVTNQTTLSPTPDPPPPHLNQSHILPWFSSNPHPTSPPTTEPMHFIQSDSLDPNSIALNVYPVKLIHIFPILDQTLYSRNSTRPPKNRNPPSILPQVLIEQDRRLPSLHSPPDYYLTRLPNQQLHSPVLQDTDDIPPLLNLNTTSEDKVVQDKQLIVSSGGDIPQVIQLRLDATPLILSFLPTTFGLGAGLGFLATHWTLANKFEDYASPYTDVNVNIVNNNSPTLTASSSGSATNTNTNNDGDTNTVNTGNTNTVSQGRSLEGGRQTGLPVANTGGNVFRSRRVKTTNGSVGGSILIRSVVSAINFVLKTI